MGRPRTDAVPITLRLRPSAIAAIDNWRREQPDLPTRPEAVRRLVEKALGDGRPAVPPTDNEPPLILPEDEVSPEDPYGLGEY